MYDDSTFKDSNLVHQVLNLMATIHKNDEDQILNCLRLHSAFDHEVCNTYELFMHLKDVLPKNPLCRGAGKWFFNNLFSNILAILTLALVVINEGLDANLTYDYFYWDTLVNTYHKSAMNATFSKDFMISQNEMGPEDECSIACNMFDCDKSMFAKNVNEVCYPTECFLH